MATPEEIESQQQAEEAKGKASPFKEAWSDMTMGRRLMVMAAASLIMGGFIALLLWINKPDYQVLYSGLAQTDASKVVEKLKELKIPFQLEGDGTVVKIPQDQVYETRLAMASAGLPRGSGVGFEVFNEVKMGTTEFVQKINYQRALQGELARTISSFGEVDDARVHIVMPRDSLFVEEEKKPTAAVVLRLAAGRTLNKGQIQGIVHLVAGSVPDLDDAHVTVVDSKGNLLFRKDQDSAGFPAALTASQLEYQRTTESQISNKVQTMLEEVLGLGRAVVRVSADIDFTRTEEVKDLFDPDQAAVRSETRSTESSKNAGDLPVGAPDNRFTLAQRNAAPGLDETGTSERKREDETTNFEISRTKRQTLKALGGLNKLSVAVMVDGPYKETVDKEGVTTRAFAPRSAQEMAQLSELVRRAVGYDENRGDEVTVANVPFALPPGAGAMAGVGWQEYLDKYGRQALNLILALLFFLMVVRPLMKYLVAKKAKEELPAEAVRVGPGEELPPGEELEQLEGMDVSRQLGTRDMILALAQQDPERTTAVLRSWIHQN
jgi:flagellar M-ring protein FliF